MKILVLGGSGMLGHKLVQQLSDDFDVWTTIRGEFERLVHFGIFERERTIEQVDVEDSDTLTRIIESVAPNVIFNAIGVVKQVPTATNAAATIALNSLLPHQLAYLAEGVGARLITISTDCVFDGTRGMTTEVDHPNATDLYGKSKHLGEVEEGNALTLRTSIIGRELGTRHSLVEWFLSNRGKTVKGFTHAIYSGFPTIIFAEIVANLIKNHAELRGLYHVSSDAINKYDLLLLLRKYYGVEIEIEIERFDDFKIDRSLDSTKFREVTKFKPRSWEEMIAIMASDPTPYDSFSL